MTINSIELREGRRHVGVEMPYGVAAELARLNVATVLPSATPGSFDLINVRKVGVLTIEGLTVRIDPKTPISRLFAMLVHSRDPNAMWRDDDVSTDTDEDLYSTIAHAFARTLHGALAGGVHRGYVQRDDALPLVRGRWRIADQLATRAGQLLPLEVTFDDFSEDVALNRIFVTAIRRLLRFPELPSKAEMSLRQDLRVLSGVPALPWGAPLPRVSMNRRIERFRLPLELARIILDNLSLEHRNGEVVGSGFLVDLWAVFEDFVGNVIQATDVPGRIRTQSPHKLDQLGRIGIEPDLLWFEEQRVVSCADIKYKVERGGSVPNADLYQLIAYCSRFGLAEGHLIYAEADDTTRRIDVIGGPTIHRHALRLDQPIAEVERQLRDIAEQIYPARQTTAAG